jgi:hypothetical protein
VDDAWVWRRAISTVASREPPSTTTTSSHQPTLSRHIDVRRLS